MAEHWLPVPDYPGYEVSTRGRVRSLDRTVEGRGGFPKRLKGKVLAQSLMGGNGEHGRYYACVLYRNGTRRTASVHILMLETFVGPRPAGRQGCHKDDDPVHNELDNLYWGTQKQNVGDAIRSGRHMSAREAAKTKCPQGHKYTPRNTYIKPSTGHRTCRTCRRDEVAKYNQRQKLKS